MSPESSPPFSFFSVIAETARVFVKNVKSFLIIAILATIAGWGLILAGIWASVGNPMETLIDPQVMVLTRTREQLLMGGAALILALGSASVGIAATIHAAAAPGLSGLGALRRVSATGMQMFWLHLVVYALAIRFSPVAALLMWVLGGFAIPVAICENRGPTTAFDRAWELSNGFRGRILLAELLLPFLPLAVAGFFAYLAMPDGDLVLADSTWRFSFSWVPFLCSFVALQFVFAVLTRIYLALAAKPEPALHARAASNVSS